MCPVERAYAPKRGMKTIPRDDVHGDGKQPLERGPNTPGPGHKLISTFTRTRVQYRTCGPFAKRMPKQDA